MEQKNPMEQDSPPCQKEDKLASESATSESEKPMEKYNEDHKKPAHIPNNVSIRENSSNCGNLDTGTPDQK